MHHPVLLQEAIEALVTTPGGFYVDGTFGRGGHSRALLHRLGPEGRVLGIDKDPAAASVAAQLAGEDGRFSFCQGSFAGLPERLVEHEVVAVDGILLDLGVSSPQLDAAERGFSFSQDGPLDMRMDTSRGQTAAEWLATADEAEIALTLREFGEERFARRIARALVEARAQQEITTTARLAQLVSAANPRWEKHKHPATRAFQAIRIRVNRELEDLQALLGSALSLLAVGGRLVVISFHSLEDRLVKRYMRDMARGPELPRGLPIPESAIHRPMKLVGRALRATAEEVAANPRARSAIMRVAEKVG